MPTTPKIEQCERVLVVEGPSDLWFYLEVLKFLGKADGVFIQHFNGRQALATKLETFLTPVLLTSKKSIGFIIDANGNAAGATQQLTDLLQRTAAQTVTAGQWTVGSPKLGFFIAPDGVSGGEIETLVWKAWAAEPKHAKMRKCIEDFRDCMKASDEKIKSSDKGLVSSLLAILHEDDPRLGPGAREGKFDFTRPEYGPLKTFLSGI